MGRAVNFEQQNKTATKIVGRAVKQDPIPEAPVIPIGRVIEKPKALLPTQRIPEIIKPMAQQVKYVKGIPLEETQKTAILSTLGVPKPTPKITLPTQRIPELIKKEAEEYKAGRVETLRPMRETDKVIPTELITKYPNVYRTQPRALTGDVSEKDLGVEEFLLKVNKYTGGGFTKLGQAIDILDRSLKNAVEGIVRGVPSLGLGAKLAEGLDTRFKQQQQTRKEEISRLKSLGVSKDILPKPLPDYPIVEKVSEFSTKLATIYAGRSAIIGSLYNMPAVAEFMQHFPKIASIMATSISGATVGQLTIPLNEDLKKRALNLATDIPTYGAFGYGGLSDVSALKALPAYFAPTYISARLKGSTNAQALTNATIATVVGETFKAFNVPKDINKILEDDAKNYLLVNKINIDNLHTQKDIDEALLKVMQTNLSLKYPTTLGVGKGELYQSIRDEFANIARVRMILNGDITGAERSLGEELKELFTSGTKGLGYKYLPQINGLQELEEIVKNVDPKQFMGWKKAFDMIGEQASTAPPKETMNTVTDMINSKFETPAIPPTTPQPTAGLAPVAEPVTPTAFTPTITPKEKPFVNLNRPEESLIKDIKDSIRLYQQIGISYEGDIQPKNAGLERLQELYKTPVGERLKTEGLNKAINKGDIKLDNGEITLFRAGFPVKEERFVSATYDKDSLQGFIEGGKLKGIDVPITEFKVKPDDIKVFIGGGEKEVLLPNSVLKEAIQKPAEAVVEAPEIKYEPTIKESGLARSVKTKAIKDKMIYAFDRGLRELPEYDKRIKSEDFAKATDFVLNNYNEALKVVFEGKKPPIDVLPEDIFVALDNYATLNKDVDMIRKLATQSGLIGEATLMGQRIQALSQLNPDSALNKIKEVQKVRAKTVEKVTKKTTKEVVKNIKKETTKVNLSKEELSWDNFLESITC